MSIDQLARAGALAAGLGALLLCGGCAAGMGSMAGTAIGGMAKGGMVAAKVTGKTAKVGFRTARGAARGVHNEFSGSKADGGEPVAAEEDPYADPTYDESEAAEEEPVAADDEVRR